MTESVRRHAFRRASLCLLALLLAVSVDAFADQVVFSRTIHRTTPQEAYRVALQAWKQNLGLWFVPLTVILEQGDPQTGAGLVLLRIPPFLKEGIVGREELEHGGLKMTYKVLNPSFLTWPIQDHIGEISFRRSSDKDEVTTKMEWKVQWTPLAEWTPYFREALKAITTVIIGMASDYVVELSKSPPEKDASEL